MVVVRVRLETRAYIPHVGNNGGDYSRLINTTSHIVCSYFQSRDEIWNSSGIIYITFGPKFDNAVGRRENEHTDITDIQSF